MTLETRVGGRWIYLKSRGKIATRRSHRT
jgi:hypothetical protein